VQRVAVSTREFVAGREREALQQIENFLLGPAELGPHLMWMMTRAAPRRPFLMGSLALDGRLHGVEQTEQTLPFWSPLMRAPAAVPFDEHRIERRIQH
jgi:hypothetical protein